jgi:hypothetical protein
MSPQELRFSGIKAHFIKTLGLTSGSPFTNFPIGLKNKKNYF